MNIETLNSVFNAGATVIGVIGAIALVSSIIVEFTKELGFIKNIPTKFYTMIIGIIIAVGGGITFDLYTTGTVRVSMIPLCIIAGVIASFVAVNGWTAFNELFNKFVKKNGDK